MAVVEGNCFVEFEDFLIGGANDRPPEVVQGGI